MRSVGSKKVGVSSLAAEFQQPVSHSMRQLSTSNKKPRGVRRRLRALEKWATRFEGWFPEELQADDRYINWKIPVLQNLIEGRHASRKTQAKCAQHLIDACHRLIQAKPSTARNCRVTCVVCLPDMFTSEICIYLQEAYFQSHTAPSIDSYGFSKIIAGRSLAQEWGLRVPERMAELGIALDYRGFEDRNDWFVGTRWYFGELQPRG